MLLAYIIIGVLLSPLSFYWILSVVTAYLQLKFATKEEIAVSLVLTAVTIPLWPFVILWKLPDLITFILKRFNL
jgi:hypothetical protein